jgi:hypothetical protein
MIAGTFFGRLIGTSLLGIFGFACSADPGRAEPLGDGGSASGGSPSAGYTAVGGGPNQPAPTRCRPPAGVSGSPRTIDEAIALLNALPKPTSVACFVESLDRPLTVYATSSGFSAQPAFSAQSPRIFIKRDRLWLSVVMDGDSSYLIEFSYLQPDNLRSIKGEVQAPVNEQLAPGAPYDRVRYGAGTICGACHSLEEPAPSVSFTQAFASTAYRPRPETHVSLDSLSMELERCNFSAEPHRCEMLSAVLDGGPVVEEAFPISMPTFF